MDSISPEAVRTAGNHTVAAARTFFGKLMDTFWLGTPAPALATPRAPPYHRADHSSSRVHR